MKLTLTLLVIFMTLIILYFFGSDNLKLFFFSGALIIAVFFGMCLGIILFKNIYEEESIDSSN